MNEEKNGEEKKMNETETKKETAGQLWEKTITITRLMEKCDGFRVFNAYCHHGKEEYLTCVSSPDLLLMRGQTYRVRGYYQTDSNNSSSFVVESAVITEERLIPASGAQAIGKNYFNHCVCNANYSISEAAHKGECKAVGYTSDPNCSDKICSMLQEQGYQITRAEGETAFSILWEPAFDKLYDIGELPPVVNPEAKARAALDFRFFCEFYLPETFHSEWSANQLLLIDKLRKAVLCNEELSAIALPRGEGKSSLLMAATLWTAFYGHHEFIALIGTDISDFLDYIKNEIENNNWLMADFPEVCVPIRALEGIPARARKQGYKGERTGIIWTLNKVVLPSINGSKASGVVICAAGLTNSVRGLAYQNSDGVTVRPSLVFIEDPQNTKSAESLEQTRKRMAIINGDVLGLAGPGKKIAGVMPCTVIKPGDLADQILDIEKHPEWNGIRTRMMTSFPKNTALWNRYAEIRGESLREHGDIRDATEFYRENRAAMDEGASVSWESRFNDDEISAIQNAMNLKIQDEASFFAEYQNEPASVNKKKATV